MYSKRGPTEPRSGVTSLKPNALAVGEKKARLAQLLARNEMNYRIIVSSGDVPVDAFTS